MEVQSKLVLRYLYPGSLSYSRTVFVSDSGALHRGVYTRCEYLDTRVPLQA